MHAAAGVTPLRLVLADDTVEIRTLLRKSFELDPTVTVVGEAGNGAEAVEVAERTNPDVVLLDLAMPVMDGLQAIPEIRRRCPATGIVVLSGFDASRMAERAIDAGAAAYVSKGAGPDRILAVVHRVGGPQGGAAGQAREGGGEAIAVPSIESAYRRKRDLLPLLTHEISNQLTVVQGFAEMLRDGIGSLPDETARQFAEAIVRNSRMMSSLIDAVSDLRRLELGEQLSLELSTVDLVPLVRETLEDLRAQLGERHVSLAVPPRVVGVADPVRVRQVLTNLLSNAARFTPPDAAVSVELRVTEDRVELVVADDGPGIPPGRRHELFEKFSRLGSTVKGTGIGLYLSRAIARAHGGDLVHVAQPVGARFALWLPRPVRKEGQTKESQTKESRMKEGRTVGGRRRTGAGPAPAPATT